MAVKYIHDDKYGRPTPIHTGDVEESVTIDVSHHMMHDENSYIASLLNLDVPANGDISIGITPAAAVGSLDMVLEGVGGGTTIMRLLGPCTFSGVNYLPVVNRNRFGADPIIGATPTIVSLVRNPTLLASGTLLTQRLIPSGTTIPTLADGVVGKNGWEIVGGVPYLVQLENLSNVPQPMNIVVKFIKYTAGQDETWPGYPVGTPPVSVFN